MDNGASIARVHGFGLLLGGRKRIIATMSPAERDAYLDAQFPTRRTMLYANHAAISPWPKAATQAAAHFAEECSQDGPMAVARWLIRETRLRRSYAAMLNAASEDDIALLHNTSAGINVVAAGIDWQPGDNVVSSDREFPSNALPWAALRTAGVEHRRIPLRNTTDPEGAILQAIDGRTRVVAVSAVQWHDGFRLDLKRIGAGLDANVCLLVDAIQQVGALRLDVQGCRISALAAGAHKWQMGPEGVGVFYCAPRWRECFRLDRHGWRMLNKPFQFGQGEHEVAGSARRFEFGSPNSIGHAALSGSLAVIEHVGMAHIEQRVLDNTARLLDGLADIPGIELLSDPAPQRRSGIVCFRAPGTRGETLRHELSRRKIFTAVRGDGIRLSLHAYQGQRETDRVLAEVREII